MLEAKVIEEKLKLVAELREALIISQDFHPALVDQIVAPKLFDEGRRILESTSGHYRVEAVPLMRVRGELAGQAAYYSVELRDPVVTSVTLYPYGKIHRGKRIHIEAWTDKLGSPAIDNPLAIDIASSLINRLSSNGQTLNPKPPVG